MGVFVESEKQQQNDEMVDSMTKKLETDKLDKARKSITASPTPPMPPTGEYNFIL